MLPPRVLIIAGSDSSGGATNYDWIFRGLEADQKVMAAHQCYAMTATTALTVQNTMGVRDVHITPSEIVRAQIDAVVEDVGVDVVKIGMLACTKTVQTVADALKKYEITKVVLDPVMVSTSGSQLLPGDAVKSLREQLLPLATVLTPNIPEATLLLRDADVKYKSPSNLDDLKILAAMVQKLGPQAILLKGGHVPLTKGYARAMTDEQKDLTVDILYDGTSYTVIESPYLRSKNTHGTGCSLASAIAANLAKNQELAYAAKNACRYVGAGIRMSFDIGQGAGPINHFHSMQCLPFAAGYFLEYLLERPDVQPVWHAYTHHRFVNEIAEGTMSEDLFHNYLVQDYLYLTHFARTNALAAYKSKNIDDIAASATIVQHIQTEMELHLDYCKSFGLEKEDIEKHKESQACVAYSRYILDVGQSEDWLALQLALAPCLIGYSVAAKRLHNASTSVREGNKYWKWVENYVAEEYQESVRTGSALIEKHIVRQSPSRVEELIAIFIRATEMEIGFWEAGAHDLSRKFN